jgi:hypothetical protein
VVDICKGFKTPILMRHGRPGEEGLALSIYYTKPFSGDRTLDLVAATPDVRGKNLRHCIPKLAYHGFAEPLLFVPDMWVQCLQHLLASRRDRS